MDFLDIFESTPKDKFLECLKHANAGALEKRFDDLIKEQYAMMMMLEQSGKTEKDIRNFIIENDDEIKSRFDDFYIDFMAKVYGVEG